MLSSLAIAAGPMPCSFITSAFARFRSPLPQYGDRNLLNISRYYYSWSYAPKRPGRSSSFVQISLHNSAIHALNPGTIGLFVYETKIMCNPFDRALEH
jgi:hypothetical protein